MNINDYLKTGEKPLDNIVSDGGFCGILRTVACIGDSLSSGEFEVPDENGNKTYHDMFEYSWGQYMARMAGFKTYNFSRGGMTAEVYMNSFAEENNFFAPEKAAQAYIIALGANDLYNRPDPVIGKASDCEDGTQSFAGYYGRIIKKYKEISPDAKFFFVTFPRDYIRTDVQDERREKHRELMYEFAEYFNNSYVIDLMEYAPVYDEAFKKDYFMGGHMNPAGYLLTAKMFLSYIDWIIRHNMKDFEKIGFIKTERE